MQGTREKLRQSVSEHSVLKVKLKHARNQVEVEMKKRHRAEAELEKQVLGGARWRKVDGGSFSPLLMLESEAIKDRP